MDCQLRGCNKSQARSEDSRLEDGRGVVGDRVLATELLEHEPKKERHMSADGEEQGRMSARKREDIHGEGDEETLSVSRLDALSEGSSRCRLPLLLDSGADLVVLLEDVRIVGVTLSDPGEVGEAFFVSAFEDEPSEKEGKQKARRKERVVSGHASDKEGME
jgi:hypothetical protein